MSIATIGLYTDKSVFQVLVVNATEDAKLKHLAAARFNPTTEATVR